MILPPEIPDADPALSPEGADPDAPQLVVVRVPRGRRVVEYIAVLEAAGIEVDRPLSSEGSHRLLLIPPEHADTAALQLSLFESEQRNWPPPEAAPGPSLNPDRPSFVVGLGLLLLFFVSGAGNTEAPAYIGGAADAAAILGGQWYRCVTALTLHADFGHVAANASLAALLGSFLAAGYGAGWSWLLILLTGAAGNAATAYWLGPEHRAIGASTAVFAAMGLLAGARIRWLFSGAASRSRIWIPLVAAAAFYFYMGNDPETDRTAHLCGLLAGITGGICVPAKLPRGGTAIMAGTLALTILATSWALAARNG